MNDVVSGCERQCGARTVAYPGSRHEDGHGICNLGRDPATCRGPVSFEGFMALLRGALEAQEGERR
jgi:hypothetical protein